MQKIPVIILGATGLVGQKLVDLLIEHPWFEIEVLAASESSAGKKYGDLIHWQGQKKLPLALSEKIVQKCIPINDIPLAFSALDSSIAFEIEESFLRNGTHVISNAKNFRNHKDVPIIIPEVNNEHLMLLNFQKHPGKIITNPNCVVAGLALALKPLFSNWGIKKLHVSTMQAVSGAGQTNLLEGGIQENILPHIEDEESKVENEPKKILGVLKEGFIQPASLSISAQCNRVPVLNGHFMNISLELEKKTSLQELITSWKEFKSPVSYLPSALTNPFIYFEDKTMPQPKLHENLGKGMSISIGKVQHCHCLDFKFNVLVNNLVRGAAGASILSAELFVHSYLLSPSIINSNLVKT